MNVSQLTSAQLRQLAKLVEANCRNVGALMGSTISPQQIVRLVWIQSRLKFPHILLFLDRDRAGRDGTRKAQVQLSHHDLAASVFDWDRKLSANDQVPMNILESIQDPADMSVEQLRRLRSQRII